jgi:hypothetical protein
MLSLDEGNAAHANVRPGQIPLRALGGDDLQAGELRRIDLIPLPMIPVSVAGLYCPLVTGNNAQASSGMLTNRRQ